jgi:hypothetical protein
MQLVYGKPSTELDNDNSKEDSSDEEFFIPKGQKKVTMYCMQDNLLLTTYPVISSLNGPLPLVFQLISYAMPFEINWLRKMSVEKGVY